MRLQAQRFLNLLTVLPLENKVKLCVSASIVFAPQMQTLTPTFWILSVRATYCTGKQPLPTDKFLFEEEAFNPSKYSSMSPIVHLTPTDLVACLNKHDLECIEATVARGKMKVDPEKKRLVLSNHQVDSQGYKPAMLPTEFSEDLKLECQGCRATFESKKLLRCGACKMVFYCGPECQKSHWPTHKVLCKFTQKNRKAAAAQ
ncbi:hypothetical protein JCM3766R1_004209 [Sporobolomyces carnicolor]